jgi:hypothetical protein
VGGVYTSLAVPELGVVFDAGASPRSSCAIDTILLSHGHADHVGALPAFLGIRALSGKTRPPRVVMPAEIVDDLTSALTALSRMQRFPLAIEAIGMLPDQTYEVQHTTVAPGSTLFLFSDGAYEILTKDEERWELENLLPLLMEPAVPGVTEPNRVYRKVREAAKAGPLDDDFSLIALTFP